MIHPTSNLDQLDLFGGVAQVAPPVIGEPKTELYRVSYRVESLPDGRLRTYDYRHLPPEKRPISICCEVQSWN